MVCLLDLPGRYLLLTCQPCGRHGRYRINRLRKEHGDLARCDEVVVRLTQSCRWQRAVGNPRRAYSGGCQVAVDVDVSSNGKGTGRSRL